MSISPGETLRKSSGPLGFYDLCIGAGHPRHRVPGIYDQAGTTSDPLVVDGIVVRHDQNTVVLLDRPIGRGVDTRSILCPRIGGNMGRSGS